MVSSGTGILMLSILVSYSDSAHVDCCEHYLSHYYGRIAQYYCGSWRWVFYPALSAWSSSWTVRSKLPIHQWRAHLRIKPPIVVLYHLRDQLAIQKSPMMINLIAGVITYSVTGHFCTLPGLLGLPVYGVRGSYHCNCDQPINRHVLSWLIVVNEHRTTDEAIQICA